MATGTIKTNNWKLLWTNPNPSADFVAQTIPLDLSGYEEVKIEYGWSNDGYPQNSVFCRSGLNVTLYTFSGFGSGSMIISRRTTTVTGTGISFAESVSKATNSTSAASSANNQNVPYYIYIR